MTMRGQGDAVGLPERACPREFDAARKEADALRTGSGRHFVTALPALRRIWSFSERMPLPL
jgi:hypothetical protein